MATNDERLSGALQENVLVLLCFNSEAAGIIRAAVTPALFESRVYQDIASKAITFYDLYQTAIAEHLPDVLEEVLLSDDRKKVTLYKRALDNLHAAKEHVNSKYVIEKLQEFVHVQTLKVAILKAVEHVEAGRIDEAENALDAGMKAQLPVFDMGTSFSDPTQSLRFLAKVDDGIPLGIKALDDAGIMPSPGTMMLFIAPAKKGKSWFLVHGGKFSLLQRKRVLHITLEMSEDAVAMRYIQSIFSVTKRQAKVKIPKLKRSENGMFLGVDFEDITRPTLGDAGVKKFLEDSLRARFKGQNPLIIKGFPMGSLTIEHFDAYLDTLERLHKWSPEVLVFDYPDLMQIDAERVRTDTSGIFKNLRGLITKRNYALITATQGNRESASARVTKDTHVAEDYSKIATADTVLTYSQTEDEKRLGLARIFVSNARNEEDKFTVMVTQSYPMGQFALDSQRMSQDYWRRVDAQSGKETPEEEDK